MNRVINSHEEIQYWENHLGNIFGREEYHSIGEESVWISHAYTGTTNTIYHVSTASPYIQLDGMKLITSFGKAQEILAQNGWQPFYRDSNMRYYGKVINHVPFEVVLDIRGFDDDLSVGKWTVRNGINPDYLGETSRAFWRRLGYTG